MFDILKNSKGEILNLLFKDPEKEYYLTEIAKNLGKEPGEIQLALNKLVAEGIIMDERKANLRFFWLNKNYPIYEEIKSIISKTLGIELKMKNLINDLPAIQTAFIFGSFAKGKEYSESDIDLFLIGENEPSDLTEKIDQLEKELKREINYQIYSKNEVLQNLKDKNSFFLNVFNEPKIILKGDLNDFKY